MKNPKNIGDENQTFITKKKRKTLILLFSMMKNCKLKDMKVLGIKKKKKNRFI